jgi:acetylglutamate kinase
VRDASGRVIPRLDAAACERLIREGIATGGMQAKLNAASEALRRGIAEVVIAPGAEPEIVRRLLGGEPVGSRLAGARA